MTSASVVSRRARARRTAFLAAIAAVLGVIGGGAAWVLLHLIGLITNVVLFHQWGWTLPSFENFHPGPILFVEAAGGALVVSLLARWSPVIRGHGIPEAMESILTRQSRIAPPAAVAKPLSAAVAIGTGGPFGAEGPIIVTGGAFGSLIGQAIRVTPSERKILLACGAAAGMSATFGTPLAAVVLAIELLLFEFSNRAFVPLVVASSVAGAMHAALFGAGPLFHVPPHDYAGLDDAPGVRGDRDRVRFARRRDLQGPLSPGGWLPSVTRLRVLASDHRRPGVRRGRPRRAARPRRRVRHDQRHPRQPHRGGDARGAAGRASSWRGGSRSGPARREARSLRSCSPAARSAA